MSSMYVRNGLGAVSVRDIPLISNVFDYADRKVREAIETIVTKYAEFERAAMEAPAIAEDAQRVVDVVSRTGTPQQLTQALAYQREARKLVEDVANRGPVDQVVGWVESLRTRSGMGALPAIPVAIVAAAAAAAFIVSSAVKSYTTAKTVRMGIQAGLTPQQLGALAAQGGNPFKAGLFGLTGGVTLAALAVGGFLLLGAMRK